MAFPWTALMQQPGHDTHTNWKGKFESTRPTDHVVRAQWYCIKLSNNDKRITHICNTRGYWHQRATIKAAWHHFPQSQLTDRKNGKVQLMIFSAPGSVLHVPSSVLTLFAWHHEGDSAYKQHASYPHKFSVGSGDRTESTGKDGC